MVQHGKQIGLNRFLLSILQSYIYNNDGEIEGIDYTQFVSHLIKLCQIQQKQIDELEKRVEALENR